jgi:hypothetical protein
VVCVALLVERKVWTKGIGEVAAKTSFANGALGDGTISKNTGAAKKGLASNFERLEHALLADFGLFLVLGNLLQTRLLALCALCRTF